MEIMLPFLEVDAIVLVENALQLVAVILTLPLLVVLQSVEGLII